MRIRITMLEELLGTKAANKEVFADYIASKAPDDDLRRQELETAEHKEESGTTVFHRDINTGELILWDYQIKGFLKEAADTIRQCNPKGKGNAWASARRRFDNFVFIYPRMISLGKSEPDGVKERPIRCETVRGPRVTVARSETVNAGTSFECDIIIMNGSPITEDMIKKCLDYGQYKGLGQWRNSGAGRIRWELLD